PLLKSIIPHKHYYSNKIIAKCDKNKRKCLFSRYVHRKKISKGLKSKQHNSSKITKKRASFKFS
ncbi:hypothetical protein, partial [uncultured Campylobacter sp.]|uniref:hypothetical protein n=1 Tax=uncultured Campylobacter sp. TaxID=218934 RepID=UPI00260C4357